MSAPADPVCFTCGMPSGAAALLNRMPNGQICPACRDRVLDQLAPAIPVDRFVVAEFGAPAAAEAQEEASSRTQEPPDSKPPWPPRKRGA